MSDNGFDINSADGGGLRRELERVLAENKAMRGDLDGLRATQRTRDAEAVLSARGLNPGLAKFVPAEAAGDPKAMDSWINENQALFAVAPLAEQSPAGTEIEDPIDAVTRDGWPKISRVAANGNVEPVDLRRLRPS